MWNRPVHAKLRRRVMRESSIIAYIVSQKRDNCLFALFMSVKYEPISIQIGGHVPE